MPTKLEIAPTISQEDILIKSAQATVRVLMAFEGQKHDLGVTDIATITGYGKSHVAKLLAVLKAEGAVTQVGSRKYRIAQRIFGLGSHFVRVSPLATTALPVMQDLSAVSGHSITLTIREGNEILHLMAVDGPKFPECRWRVGQTVTYHTSAAARVLLAHMQPHHIEFLVRTKGLPRMTDQTIVDKDAFKATLEKTRDQGYAFTVSEGVSGLAGLAVPVMTESGEVVAALAALFPELLLPNNPVEPLCRDLWKSARSLSLSLGCKRYPFARTSRRKTATLQRETA